jgi:heat shock protein HslJ
VVSIDGERELFLQLRADSLSLKGFAGCNAVMGSYTVENNMLTFSKVASTRKYCAPAMDQEQAYIESLALVVSYKIKGERLFLYGQNEKLLFELESVYLK